jgi:hypothetical protein
MTGSLQPPQHLSSVYGRIEQVLLVRAGFDNASCDSSLREIISKYEAHGIEVLVLEKDAPQPKPSLHNSADMSFEHPMVSEMLQRGRHTELKAEMNLAMWQREFEVITEIGLPLVHSEWAQDGFCVLVHDAQTQVLLQSLSSRRFLDQFVSYELALKRKLSMYLMPTLTEWEGGNVLVGDKFALVGKNTLASNWQKTIQQLQDSDRADQILISKAFDLMKQDMEAQLGLEEVIWVGYPNVRRDLMNQKHFCYQPLFHIDLFLTLGGKDAAGSEILFLSDPSLGWALLRSAGLHDFIGPTGLVACDGEPLTEQMVAYSICRDTNDFFDAYNKSSMAKRQFRLVSLPMLIEAGVVYSWNNCLVEVANESSKAFVPNYIMADAGSRALVPSEVRMNQKMRVLQDAVERIMQEQGIREIVWTGHGIFMQHFSRRKGSLHCLTKVLRRDHYDWGN